MKKAKISIIIGLIVICITSIFIILYFLKFDNISEEAKKELQQEEQDISNLMDTAFKEVDNYNTYYSVSNMLHEYMAHLKNINGDKQFDWEILGISEEEALAQIKEDEIKAIYNSFDRKYIDECNITEENIVNVAESLKQKGDYTENIVYNLNIEEMYAAEISPDILLVLVDFNINKEEFEFMYKLDLSNRTYAMFGQEYIEKYNYSKDTELSSLDITVESIESNEYNQFTYINATTEYIVSQYFSDFKDKMLNDTEVSYELIDEEYKAKKYGKYENYASYVEDSYYEIQGATISKYLVNNYEDFTEYICIDQNGKYYIFSQESMTKYNVILDTYTINLPDFKEKYDSGDEQVKVGMNIEKIIEAINTKDFAYIYNNMDETFRNNNFSNLENFEEYIINNFYEYNEVEYKNFNNEGDIYIYTIQVKNAQNEESEAKDGTIIMKLLDDYNYVMSFNME